MVSPACKLAIGRTINVIAAAMSVYHMYAIAIAPPEAMIFRAWHLLFAIVLVYLICPFRTGREMATPSVADLALAGLSVVCIGYLFVELQLHREPHSLYRRSDPHRHGDGGADDGAGARGVAARGRAGALPATALAFAARYAFFC